jgi:hypothetical protein
MADPGRRRRDAGRPGRADPTTSSRISSYVAPTVIPKTAGGPGRLPHVARTPTGDERGRRILVALVVTASVGIGAWAITHPEPSRSERIPACGPGAGLPCSFLRADGARMVRWSPARGVEDISAAEFDQAYLDWLEEIAPPCPGMGIGPTSPC